MVGVKQFHKGFYKEFILMWLQINKENKALSLSEIRTLLNTKYNKKYIQPKIYKTLVFMKENNLSIYQNLKWKLDLNIIKSYYQSEEVYNNLKLKNCIQEYENEIKDLQIVINKLL